MGEIVDSIPPNRSFFSLKIFHSLSHFCIQKNRRKHKKPEAVIATGKFISNQVTIANECGKSFRIALLLL